MTKWEYMFVEGNENRVSIVSDRVLTEEDYPGILGGKTVGRLVRVFLEESGQEGWEVAGMTGTQLGGWLMVLKRPVS